MDINETLRRLREILRDSDIEDVDIEEIAILFHALDQWLSRKGFLPDAWARSEAKLATLDSYMHRNKLHGRRYRYTKPTQLARAQAAGDDISDGMTGTIVEVYDFDYPYLIELEDGRKHRAGRGLSGWTEIEPGYR